MVTTKQYFIQTLYDMAHIYPVCLNLSYYDNNKTYLINIVHDMVHIYQEGTILGYYGNNNTYLIETLYDMGHVYPRGTILVHLMENIISEQFDHVAVPCLRPLGVKIKPARSS